MTPGTTAPPGRLRNRIAAIYGLLALANLAAWAWALVVFHDRPVLLGTALLAYGFGLRHAVDADHIAAIDNVTRKLMQAGQRPATVGLYFAIGHSAVVFIAVAILAAGTAALTGTLDRWRPVGGLVGTTVSILFLLAIAASNLALLAAMARTPAAPGPAPDHLLEHRGFLARLFRPVFRLVTRPWHMAPLGILFGLGFDTATEIALLGVAATQASHGIPVSSILVFPALFAAAMALVDTTDGILMLRAYGWAAIEPTRKRAYNIAITALSVLVAALVATVETLGLLREQLELEGRFWTAVATLNDNMGALGLTVIALFAAAWAAAAIIWRYAGPGPIQPTAPPA